MNPLEADKTGQRFDRLRHYLEIDPHNLSLLEDAAEEGLKAGLLRQTQLLLEEGLRLHPDHSGLRFRLGSVYLAAREYKDAIPFFSSLLVEGNRHPAVLYNLAFAQTYAGEPNRALETLKDLSPGELSEMPGATRLYAQLCHRREHWSEAIHALERQLERTPQEAQTWGLLSLVLFDAGQQDKARQAGMHSLALEPNEISALIALGALALEERAATDALTFFVTATKQDPLNGRAWSGLGFAQLMALNLVDAQSAFLHAVSLMPDHVGTWNALAWLQILSGELVNARNSFEHALKLDRNFADTHGGLAVISALEGKDREGELAARRGTGLNRKSYAVQYAKSLLLARQGQQEQADAIVAALLQGKTDDGTATIKELVAALVRESNVRVKKSH